MAPDTTRELLIACDSELSAIAHGRPPSDKATLIDLAHRCRAIYESAPGPSDAKGDHIADAGKMVPLTDPSVRGVLVDDGEPRHLFGGDLAIIDGEIYQHSVTENEKTPARYQPVKLRPASEFGVPAEPLPVQVHRKLEAIAKSLGVKDWQAAGTSTLASLIAEAVDKLKSTPAEPAQKLVPLPEGARVFVPSGPPRGPKAREYFFDPIWGHGVFQALWDYDEGDANVQVCELLDPAPYGVPANRVRELEAENARLTKDNAAWDEACGLASEAASACRAEADRMRKAIELALSFPIHKQQRDLLNYALTPPTPTTPEVSASGDDLGTHLNLGDQLNEPKLSTAEFGKPFSPWRYTGPEADAQPPSAPAAEGEGGEKEIIRELAGFAREVALGVSTPLCEGNAKLASERDALSARLAACEERCRELEAGIRQHEDANTGMAKIHEKSDLKLWSLLAPKAEGAERCG